MSAAPCITGFGIVSAIGTSKAEVAAALAEMRSGVAAPRLLPTAHTSLPVGEVPLSNDELRTRLGLTTDAPLPRTALLGMLALDEALASAPPCPRERSAFINGTTVGGIDLIERTYPDPVGPERLRFYDCGACTDAIAERSGQFGFVSTVSTACSSALNAIIFGARLLASGRYDRVVVGGSESLSLYHFNGFRSLFILDSARCRPFCRSRNGINLGEGAAYFVMEREADAISRGARILARVSGGNACDAYHQTATSPDAVGPTLAIRRALANAGIKPSDIDYINAHGTGTANNDAAESTALRAIFGDALPPTSSTKPLTGHATSAAGAIETAICLLAIESGRLPANLGWTPAEADPDCITPLAAPIERPLRHVLCNSFAFGGNDTAVILSAPTAKAPLQSSFGKVEIEKIEPKEEEINCQLSTVNCQLGPSARRLSPFFKRILAASQAALRAAHLEQPDAIIAATAFGCLEETHHLLQELHDLGPDASQPTHFMLSTHNTPATLVARHLGCHAYNSTYCQGGASEASAALDAKTAIEAGEIDNALIIAADQTTPQFDALRQAAGGAPPYYRDRVKAYILRRKIEN